MKIYIKFKKIVQGQERNPSFSLKFFNEFLFGENCAMQIICKGEQKLSIYFRNKISL